MSSTPQSTVVIVPGLRDHVADHWQTRLAERLAEAGRTVRTVPPLEGERLALDAQVANLAATLASLHGPVLLVAHSAGVITTVHWAARRKAQVRGALLATPPDFETPLPHGYPTPAELARHGWTPVPRGRLPFPSIVAASANDPLCTPDRAAALARGWGSHLVELGAVGHLNPASGHGEWLLAEELIGQLESNAVSLPLGATPAGERG
ncbi:hydrolase [Streptomyces davaonensis JCM 4913]|uniref:Hydrolase n=1 Tax=Streptomyces davaonensis (strain DSM 101723 / JCM 4913 / KCC S-0913 / 768) TaxID=1214101 RepID=K4QU97_STRDJ|nr:alpha/beta hydrolase [Streptomyces davaonensis]CCK24508.1 hydrolase [Streptomyces davaonensis JCM 4913]